MDQELNQLKAISADNEATLKAAARMNAHQAVDRAVERGVIPARDTALKARWLRECEEDPIKIQLLDGCLGNPVLTTGRITKPVLR